MNKNQKKKKEKARHKTIIQFTVFDSFFIFCELPVKKNKTQKGSTAPHITTYPNPGKSTNPKTGLFWRIMAYKFTDAVAPGVLPTRAESECTNLFNKDDLPTLDRPKKAISGTPNRGGNRLSKKAPMNWISSFCVLELENGVANRFHAIIDLSMGSTKDKERVNPNVDDRSFCT
jgi:hypothetical protein